jgi:hypothetical protein
MELDVGLVMGLVHVPQRLVCPPSFPFFFKKILHVTENTAGSNISGTAACGHNHIASGMQAFSPCENVTDARAVHAAAFFSCRRCCLDGWLSGTPRYL